MSSLWMMGALAVAAHAAPDLSNRIQISEVAGAVKDVKVIRVAGKKEETVRSGENLFVGDEVLVAPKQIVSLRAYDGSQWKLAPGARVKLESRKPDKQTLSYWSFQMVKGSMWGEVKKNGLDKDGFRLKVHTKTAALGIRGTEYLMDGDDKRSGVDVLEGTVWWGKTDDFAPGTYREVTAGHHAEIGADGRIVVTESKPDKAQLVKDYGLVLEAEAQRKQEGTAQHCLSLGKGWKSLNGSSMGECVD